MVVEQTFVYRQADLFLVGNVGCLEANSRHMLLGCRDLDSSIIPGLLKVTKEDGIGRNEDDDTINRMSLTAYTVGVNRRNRAQRDVVAAEYMRLNNSLHSHLHKDEHESISRYSAS
jgi:hypothetical protein